MLRPSKLVEKLEDLVEKKCGPWYERHKTKFPLYIPMGLVAWYFYGMLLNSLKLGRQATFHLPGQEVPSIWVVNPFKNWFMVFTPFGLGVTAVVVLLVCLITKKGYIWFSGYKYRGGFQYHRQTGGNLTVVNVVGLEDYVNGVICYEMGRDWPLEALKAQAMCARTYVLKNLNKHNSYGFDICTSANCQVYHGMGSNKADYGPSEVSMRAVAETAGLVIKYNGRLAETPYSSSFGGASEDAKNVWGTNTATEHPYLRGVVDPYEADAAGQNSLSSWTVSYSAAELTQRLQGYGLGVGTSVDHLVLTYSPQGNVIQTVVHWKNGQSNTVSASNIRSRFGVYAIRFTVNGAGTGEGQPPAPSGGDTVINGGPVSGSLTGKYVISGSGAVSQVGERPYAISGAGTVSALESGGEAGGGSSLQPGAGTVTVSGNSYTFNGSGYGHQLGLSQWGAYAMANRGFRYDEIVTFYLPGTQITHH